MIGVSDKHVQGFLSIFTTQCQNGNGAGMEQILPEERTAFFAYGRQALAEGLRRIGVKPGDQVLLPGLICAEVLSSLAAVGAIPQYYSVDRTLSPEEDAFGNRSPSGIRAVVAVNYFGFPQNLEPYKAWCHRHDIPLIEDNTHGFLSTDGAVPLGRRGDLGIFSLRKTIAIPNGAALVDDRPIETVGSGFVFDGSCESAVCRYRVKDWIKRIMLRENLVPVRWIVALSPLGRRLVRGVGSSTPRAVAESMVPQEAFAPMTTRLMQQCNIEEERSRRRDLYMSCANLFAKEQDVEPLFDCLPDGVVPQGFPFLYTGVDPLSLVRRWWRRSVPIVSWPDLLPRAVLQTAPLHYRKIMLVPFLW